MRTAITKTKRIVEARASFMSRAVMGGLAEVVVVVAVAVVVVVASLGCATPPPVVAPGLALRKVVIYRNGVGYFERGGRVEGDRVAFRVRKDEIGDFLASLAVLERGGSSVRSAAFPLEVEPPTPSDEALPPSPLLVPTDRTSLRTVIMSLDGKEHDLQIGYIAGTPVWRPSYRLVVDPGGAASLQAWGIVQNLSGEDWNNVSLSLVAEAPLAFDAGLGTPVIPPRPRVDDVGEVLAVVPRAETSLGQGAPAPPLPGAAADASEMAAAQSDGDGNGDGDGDATSAMAPAVNGALRRSMRKGGAAAAMAPLAKRALAPEGGVARVMAAPAPAFTRQSRNLSALAAIAVQSGTTRYDLPVTVSIPDHSATMVMLLDRRIPGETVAMYAPDPGVPDSAAHPFRVARYVNQTGGLLERGPLAIFSGGAFLGQGMADPLPDGATATVPFALDRSIAVDVGHESREEGARLAHIEGGSLSIARDSVWLTHYRVRNGGDSRIKVLIKHPRVPGARLNQPPAGTEDNVGTGSALVPGPVAARGSVELVVDERQEVNRGLDWLDPLADDAVKSYLADRRADGATALALRAAWELRQVLVVGNAQAEKMRAEQQERQRATEETRANLKALEKNAAAADLRARLTARLAGDSAKLDDLGKRLIETNLRLAEAQIRFTEAVRAIKLSKPLAAE